MALPSSETTASSTTIDNALNSPSRSKSLSKGLKFEPTAPVRPLKDEVFDLIVPWSECGDKPPYTAGQMIVMILVDNDLAPQSIPDVHKKILREFWAFTNMALWQYSWQINLQECEGYDVRENDEPQLDHVIPGLYAALKDFDLPLTYSEVSDDESREFFEEHDDEFTISAAAARVYLRDLLEPPRKGTFDFMSLPPELREKIYKMLLVFPEPGLMLNTQEVWDGRDSRKCIRLGLQSRHATVSTSQTLLTLPKIEVEVKNLGQTLAILSVSKQTRHEALPIFYGHNTLHFGSLRLFRDALSWMSSETIQQIGDLRIVMECDRLDDTPNPLRGLDRMLSALSLKKLALLMPRNTGFWTFCRDNLDSERRSATASEMKKLDSIEGLSGVVTLAKQAKHLEILGDGFMGAWVRMQLAESNEAQERAGSVEVQQEVADKDKGIDAGTDGRVGAAGSPAA